MINVSKNDPEYKSRSNPRKTIDLYKKMHGYVSSWRPTKLKAELKKLNHDITVMSNALIPAHSIIIPLIGVANEEGLKAVQSLETRSTSFCQNLT